MSWMIETLNNKVDGELNSLPADMRARFVRICELIASHGLSNVREPYVKHLQGNLWEIRITGKSGISRALYVTAQPKRLVVLRVFVKKSQKTPRKEIKIALGRAKEIRE